MPLMSMIRTVCLNLILVANDRLQKGMHVCTRSRSKAANRVYYEPEDRTRRVPDEDACGDEVESQSGDVDEAQWEHLRDAERM